MIFCQFCKKNSIILINLFYLLLKIMDLEKDFIRNIPSKIYREHFMLTDDAVDYLYDLANTFGSLLTDKIPVIMIDNLNLELNNIFSDELLENFKQLGTNMRMSEYEILNIPIIKTIFLPFMSDEDINVKYFTYIIQFFLYQIIYNAYMNAKKDYESKHIGAEIHNGAIFNVNGDMIGNLKVSKNNIVSSLKNNNFLKELNLETTKSTKSIKSGKTIKSAKSPTKSTKSPIKSTKATNVTKSSTKVTKSPTKSSTKVIKTAKCEGDLCMGVTLAGKTCKLKRGKDSKYCHHHQE